MEVAALYPGAIHLRGHHAVFDNFVGVDDKAVGVRDIAAEQNTRHALARAVLDAISAVDDQRAGVFELLKEHHRAVFATHIDDYVFLDFAGDELLFAVDLHLASALAQLLGCQVEDGGVVADMVRAVGAGSHDTGNLDFSHTC